MRIPYPKFLFGRTVIGLTFAIGFLLLFGWLAEEVFEGETHRFDETVRSFIHASSFPFLTELMKFISILGSPLFLAIVGTVAVGILLYLRNFRGVILILVTMAGEIVLNLSMKPFFGRKRPDVFFDYPLPSSFSFPSGHAIASLCFYGVVAWLTASAVVKIPVKVAIGISALVLILMIGISRIYLGVHYPSDVLAGYIAGLFWVCVVVYFFDRGLRKEAGDL